VWPAREIEEFKAEYRQRFPGRDADKLTDEDLLREVMNTVGKPGKLGEHVKCVVSVSMLTEGWDANTVTHILGVRAFGTQLLSEQVVGRALRRISYQVGEDGKIPCGVRRGLWRALFLCAGGRFAGRRGQAQRDADARAGAG
jgi:type III restriction enzyme